MTDAATGAARSADVARTVSDLRARFVAHDRYVDLCHEFDLLLHRRRADLAAGRSPEARGIAVVGNSGSGKSTAVARLLGRHPGIQRLGPDRLEADVASFLVPSPATLKSVGLACLTGLGYPLRRDRTATIIWELVQTHLHQRGILFLHLDEVQDLHVSRSKNEMQAVVNTLKSLMQNASWPVGLILSGTMALKELINLDPQLSRRLVPVAFEPISPTTHAGDVRAVVGGYAEAAGLPVDEDALGFEFVGRLVHAGADELGLVIEIAIAAIEEALLGGQASLDRGAFARAFRRRSGAVDAINPFLCDDWRVVDARLLMQAPDPEPPVSGRAGRR